MDFMQFIGRGAALAPQRPQYTGQQLRAVEAARRQWLNALLVDQTRAWLDIGASQPEVLNGLAVVLTTAGFVNVYDTRSADTPEVRIIRGAISAAEACVANGSRIREADARAFSAAARHAAAIIEKGSPAAIIHAAESIRKTVGLPS